MFTRLAYLAVFALVLVVLWGLLPLADAHQPVSHTLTLNMTQFMFEPGRITVNQGDEIVFTLTSSDVVHGFYLDGYGIQQRVEPGITREIRFTADQPGKFRYRCSVTCGPLHPFMIGELVVQTNLPFWQAVGMLLTALMLFLGYLYQRGSVNGKTSTSVTS
ncbi:MAG: cupredoxin domain-containing protein [Anaerolineae bacterium]|nr:cupredoxin domain-containing protein [Anaerolineae bacterium]